MNNDKEILKQIKKNSSKFENYNKTKLDYFFSSISNGQISDLIKSIPLFFDINQPRLPGYINSDQIPVGVSGYNASGMTMELARKMNPSLTMTKDKNATPFVQMIALMGSVGTIAFSDKSDFDFWICYNQLDYDNESIKLFRSKCRKIEEWIAEEYNVEVHFFLNEITNVRNNIFDGESEESLLGPSLGQQLKEEFLRSSIIICGGIPFWWAVPVQCDDLTYNKWLEEINKTSLGEIYIDLGNIHEIIMKDFLMAALFQILKSLGSPFKSVIKLGLLARYLHNRDENPFISSLIKSNIHEGKKDKESFDAYQIMFKLVYDYYNIIKKDNNTAEIVRTSFYLKLDAKLSKFTASKDETDFPEKIERVLKYTKEWDWPESKIEKMDGFENWDIESVNKLLMETKRFILNEYKKILEFITTNKIFHGLDNETLKGITNKIYSHFTIADNKIDNSLTFKTYPPEKFLSIDYILDKGEENWFLHKKAIERSQSIKNIIRKEKNLFSIIVWISLNGLFQNNFTRLDISSGLHSVDPKFIMELIIDLSLHFNIKKVEFRNSYFIQDAFPVISYIIFNPYTQYSKKVDDIIFLYHNSWGETLFESFKSIDDVPQIILKILNGAIVTGLDFNSALRILSSYPFHASKVYKRIKLVIEEIYSFFIGQKTNERKRYITLFNNKFFVFTSKLLKGKTIITLQQFNAELQMLYGISYNKGLMLNIKVDQSIPELNHLKTITENSKAGIIQIYFILVNKYHYYFVSDERGSIVFYRKETNSFEEYLTRLYLFAKNTVDIVIEYNEKATSLDDSKKVEMYKIERDIDLNCALIEIDPEMDSVIYRTGKKIIPLKLSIYLLDDGEIGYRFLLPDGEYSEIYNKNDIQD
ncbi:class I adenylate cyclase, partial [Spirochaetota bacterium]